MIAPQWQVAVGMDGVFVKLNVGYERRLETKCGKRSLRRKVSAPLEVYARFFGVNVAQRAAA